jgi:hypothetical protein
MSNSEFIDIVNIWSITSHGVTNDFIHKYGLRKLLLRLLLK